jgi:hypothetical protein
MDHGLAWKSTKATILTDALRPSADAYYNVGGETSIDGTSQGKDRSAPAWDYASGAVLTLFSTLNS